MEKRFVSGGGRQFVSGLKSWQTREHFATVNARGMGRRTETEFSLEHELRIRGSITIQDDVKCVRRQRLSSGCLTSRFFEFRKIWKETLCPIAASVIVVCFFPVS